MKIREIYRYYGEKRSYLYHSIEIGYGATATLDESENEQEASAHLLEDLKNRVQADADEAQIELVDWLQGVKAAKEDAG